MKLNTESRDPQINSTFFTWIQNNNSSMARFKKWHISHSTIIAEVEKPCIPLSKENALCPIDPIVPRGHFYPLIPYPVSDFLSKISVGFFPSFPFQYHKLLVQP